MLVGIGEDFSLVLGNIDRDARFGGPNRASRVIEIYDLHPGNTQPVESRSARVQYALEVNQGWFAKNGIQPGTVLATERGSLAVSVRAK